MSGSPQALLSTVNSPAALRRLGPDKLPAVACQLRQLLIERIARRGGYLAASLGVVELTIALHYAYKTPHDRLIWDGAQTALPHQILTQRRTGLRAVRKSGRTETFTRDTEEEPEALGVVHPGSSISAALGLAIGAAIKGERRRVVAVISDRALAAGMAFEALNHAGALPADLLVVLNDSSDSDSAGIGALSSHLARALSGPLYANLRASGKRMLRQMPTMRELARRSEKHLKGMVLPGTLFEEMGFNYIGPVDGHDVAALIRTLRNVQKLRGPQFLHVVTRRGKGDAPADADPVDRVPPGRFAAGSGAALDPEEAVASFGAVFGQWACEVARIDPKVVCVATAARAALGLSDFARGFPERYFDAASAEQHAVTFAAGFATEGYKPILAMDATSLARAYDQLIHDVALQKLPVMFAIGGAGLSATEGATRGGSYDLSYLRCVPGLVIMAPADENECRQMLCTARELPGPALVRYPHGVGPGVPLTHRLSALPVGRAVIRREGGSGLAVLVFGTLLETSRKIAERLDATLVNMRFVKPLDEGLVRALCARHAALVTIEENATRGGAGSAVGEFIRSQGLRIPLLHLGIPDGFIAHGSRERCLRDAGLDFGGLTARIEHWWRAQGDEVPAARGA